MPRYMGYPSTLRRLLSTVHSPCVRDVSYGDHPPDDILKISAYLGKEKQDIRSRLVANSFLPQAQNPPRSAISNAM